MFLLVDGTCVFEPLKAQYTQESKAVSRPNPRNTTDVVQYDFARNITDIVQYDLARKRDP
jgi:hypothetical protein